MNTKTTISTLASSTALLFSLVAHAEITGEHHTYTIDGMDYQG